jgi:hypothetical protein
VINGNTDVGSLEHAVEVYRIISNCELAIFPGGHGAYLGAIESLNNGRWTRFNATGFRNSLTGNKVTTSGHKSDLLRSHRQHHGWPFPFNDTLVG